MKIRLSTLLAVSIVPLSIYGAGVAAAADPVSSDYQKRSNPPVVNISRSPTLYYAAECAALKIDEWGYSKVATVCHPMVNLSPITRLRPGTGNTATGFLSGSSGRAQ